MTASHIEHIGIAVKNLEEAVQMYESIFGISCYKIEEVPDQKVRTAFFQIGQSKIELLESNDPEGPVNKFIERKGEGIHHIAIAVENLTETLKEMEVKGFQIIDKKPRRGAEGLDIAFLHPKSTGGVLLELCQDPAVKK
jgi:methylmalonyl-CoA/ethylmalonyl-CoA epimerase